MNDLKISYMQSPLGLLRISVDEQHVLSIDFWDKESDDNENSEETNALAGDCIKQLAAYFDGSLVRFNLPLLFSGTDFQNSVWRKLTEIPYGTTISYLELAWRLGNPKCIRAAASANGKNPFPVVVPCHRVIGKDGSLTGYGGGLWRKKWLLDHEMIISGKGKPHGEQMSLFE